MRRPGVGVEIGDTGGEPDGASLTSGEEDVATLGPTLAGRSADGSTTTAAAANPRAFACRRAARRPAAMAASRVIAGVGVVAGNATVRIDGG